MLSRMSTPAFGQPGWQVASRLTTDPEQTLDRLLAAKPSLHLGRNPRSGLVLAVASEPDLADREPGLPKAAGLVRGWTAF